MSFFPLSFSLSHICLCKIVIIFSLQHAFDYIFLVNGRFSVLVNGQCNITFQVPFSISKFIAAGVGISVPTKQLFKSLVLTLLIPLILGKVISPLSLSNF